MYLVTALTVLSVVILTESSCPGGEIEKTLKANAFTGDVSKLLAGKSFSDTWRKKESVTKLSCSTSKFYVDKESNSLKAEFHNIGTDGLQYHFKQTWTENKGLGTFKVSEPIEKSNEVYEIMVYTFYADDNVFGSYSCDPEDDDLWKVAISVLKDKEDDPAVKASVEKAEKVLEKLKPVIPSEFAKLTQTDCPKEV